MSDQFLAILGLFIGMSAALFATLVLGVMGKKRVANAKLEEEANALLDEHLDSIIDGLKGQIPMGSSLLTGALSEKLKNFGKKEMMKMMPKLKNKIYDRYLLPAFYRSVALSVVLGGVLGLLIGGMVGFVWLR